MSDYHTPVMLNEVLEYLDVKPGAWYVDCNLGGGGHTAGILEKGGKVIGIDLDPEAIKEVARRLGVGVQSGEKGLRGFSDNLILVQGNFANLSEIISEIASQPLTLTSPLRGEETIGRDIKIRGVLYDLGVSSYQLDIPNRGFSFNQDAPLDMRMDPSTPSATAVDLVNGLHEKELAELFQKLGDESFARPIARAIVEKRKAELITTTFQLAAVVESAKHRKHGDKIHPATKVFQALRIAVNDELNNLRISLPQAFEILEPGGRLVVISFHSLEDRVAKEFFRKIGEFREGKVLTKKPLEPSEEEISRNPRARSAKMRVLVKN